ncbi:vascular cell adhesion protein 1-like isoform X1 [Archocentrus centrarchus]|uniref:vascular cell adhesion protein 1-like isoform X1 n=1 Tax=Archocentrus centrarchus TaxID=63155 RepID=UPI0011E9F21E|nr:vascular cell adhesion protein 1-like isoform X1 [Archocentrus centrarchus]
MSQRTLFVRLSLGLVLIATGVRASCPIELSPSSVAVRYGDPVSVNCSTTVSHHGIGWEASYGGTGAEEVNQLSWTLENLTEWDISPSCFINPADSEQCMENLKIVVYTFPEKIQISSSNGPNGQMTEGKEYDIICEIPNIAPVQNLTVKWYKGDRIIKSDTFENTTFKRSVNASSRLSFKPSRQDSGARFRCEAQMDLRPVGPHFNVSSKEYNITVFFGPDVQCPDTLELLENESLEGKWNVTGNPTPSARWLKDGQPINLTAPMRRENAGMYTIEAEGLVSVQKNIIVHVLYGPELRCPSTYTADEFTPYTLNCIAEGFPKPDTVWYKDNEEVDLPEKLTRRDAGQYVITASNNHSNVSVTVEIFVQYPPSQIFELQDLEIHSGSTAELKCASRGYPRLNYTWHYYQTANVMEENEDGVSLLKIHHANADNMGSYTCDAWNSKGNVSKTVRVTVIGAKQTCPLEITPNPMVIEYKSRAQGATCSSVSTNSENVLRIHWEGVKTDNMTWWANTSEDWTLRPVCTGIFQGIGKCNNSLNYTLYKKPDSVSIYRVNTWSSVEEGKEFQLRCDIVNVAPAQKLSVLWYRNQDILPQTDCRLENNKTCKLSDVRSPVNVSSTLKVTLQKHDNGAEFRCEAQLNLGLKSPPKITSSGLNFTISYKPTINITKLPSKIPLFRGYPEKLVCEADGFPFPKIQWYYNSDKEPLVNVSEGKLIVSKPGIYTCNATNDAGHATHVLEVVLTEDYLPLIAGFVAVTVIAISIIFLFIYSIYYKNTKMRQYSFENPKFNTHNGNVAHSNGDLQFPMTKLSKQHICA